MAPLRQNAVAVEERVAAGERDRVERDFQRLKASIHEELVDSLDLSRIGQLGGDEQMVAEVRIVAEELCHERSRELELYDRERMLNDLLDEVFGLGPLEPLMQDDTITDILVNNPSEVFIERLGRLEQTHVQFADERHVMRIIQRVVARVGRRIDEVSPMVDARLPDGSRVNAIVPPLAVNGPTLSIRRFGRDTLTIQDLIANGTILPEIVQFLAGAVDARISFLISGGAGAGKTTMLNAMSCLLHTSPSPRD